MAARHRTRADVVEGMGSTLSRDQGELLCAHFDRTLLMLDGDAAGRQGTGAIMQSLAAHLPVAVISLPDAVQPDQLTAREIQRLLPQQPPTSTRAVGDDSREQ